MYAINMYLNLIEFNNNKIQFYSIVNLTNYDVIIVVFYMHVLHLMCSTCIYKASVYGNKLQ